MIIYEIKFTDEDLIECLENPDEFRQLTDSKQKELINKHAKVLAKGLESGLMDDWGFVMGVAISNTTLEADIEEALKKWLVEL